MLTFEAMMFLVRSFLIFSWVFCLKDSTKTFLCSFFSVFWSSIFFLKKECQYWLQQIILRHTSFLLFANFVTLFFRHTISLQLLYLTSFSSFLTLHFSYPKKWWTVNSHWNKFAPTAKPVLKYFKLINFSNYFNSIKFDKLS